ncbi:hypothetical protein AAHC03_024512 [Spirometra sp. Aus1]
MKTLSFIYHHKETCDPFAPSDSLDFSLTADYDNHRDWNKTRSEVLLQQDYYDEDKIRISGNQVPDEVPRNETSKHPLRIVSASERKDKNSIKNAIDGPHVLATNKGYSRKPDGTYFTG